MGPRRVHLHSILVHSVIALALLAGGAFVLERTGATIGRLAPELWPVLVRASLVGLLVLSVPAIVTGIADRNHMYATWHPSHRAKLVLSLLLLGVAAGALAATALAPGRSSAWLGAGIAINVAVVIALAAYGLRITLGRQSLARTSYVPDMWRQPPVDILQAVAAAAAEEVALIDPSEEDAA